MAASLEALRSGFTFQITAKTFLAFILGAAAVVPFWKIVFGQVSRSRKRSRHIWSVLLLLIIAALAFLYPTRFVPAEKRPELYTGLIFAVCALSLVAALLITVGRFLEKDSETNEVANPSSQESDKTEV